MKVGLETAREGLTWCCQRATLVALHVYLKTHRIVLGCVHAGDYGARQQLSKQTNGSRKDEWQRVAQLVWKPL